jgi:hypothetical protein
MIHPVGEIVERVQQAVLFFIAIVDDGGRQRCFGWAVVHRA